METEYLTAAISLDHYLSIVHKIFSGEAYDMWQVIFENGWKNDVTHSRRLIMLVNGIANYGDNCQSQAQQIFKVIKHVIMSLDEQYGENAAMKIIFAFCVKINRFKFAECGIDWREHRFFDVETLFQLAQKLDKFTFNKLHGVIRDLADYIPDDYNQMIEEFVEDDNLLVDIMNNIEIDDDNYVAPRKQINECLWSDKTCPRVYGYTCDDCDDVELL